MMGAEGQLDPAVDAVPESAAVVYAPGQRRKRFPENCVHVYNCARSALAAAEPEAGYHAAEVRGPCISSEGFRVYFLVRWLG